MAGTIGATVSSSSSSAPPAPKILLAKPGLVTAGSVAGKFGRPGCGEGAEGDDLSLRSRLPPLGSLNLLSDSWELQIDRFLPFLTDNTEFTVVGVIGPPGVGKSTIMNELYGSDGSSPGMLPHFAIESEEMKAIARHCTIGIEPRISAERILLLDTQPVYCSSVLAEMTRPDGSSSISAFCGEYPSAELAHELLSIQLGVFLASICHILLVVSEGVHDIKMWRFLLTVDLLKHGIPDPSSSSVGSSQVQSSNLGDRIEEGGEEYLAAPVIIHTKLRPQDLSPHNLGKMRKALSRCFNTSLFMRRVHAPTSAPERQDSHLEPCLDFFAIPHKSKEDSLRMLHESYETMLGELRDQVLSMKSPSFTRAVTERDWLKNSAKIWEVVRNSVVIAEYSKMLQSSGMFRR